jgi:hypothetical protein
MCVSCVAEQRHFDAAPAAVLGRENDVAPDPTPLLWRIEFQILKNHTL